MAKNPVTFDFQIGKLQKEAASSLLFRYLEDHAKIQKGTVRKMTVSFDHLEIEAKGEKATVPLPYPLQKQLYDYYSDPLPRFDREDVI